jgi:lipid II:glycine glycyltransferase (peptidoglycan interpeptide bridge formation enzyme)
MLIFTTHNFFFFSRKEIWFYDGEPLKEGTYNVFSVAKKIHGTDPKFIEKYSTCIIDLTKTEEELFNAVHPTFRYDIRAAQKHKIEYKFYSAPNTNDCIYFTNAYNLFAQTKDLPAMNIKHILTPQIAGGLFISCMLSDKEIIVTHFYFYDKKTVSLISSFHNINFKNNKLRSEANKYLHWKDILQFKSMGLKHYDFGSLNPDKLPGISKFKTSFGGETVENYRFIKSSPVVFSLINIFKKIRNT